MPMFVEAPPKGDVRETAIPVLNEPDFWRARRAISGFDGWESFDDYQMEQDGWLLGLSMAGDHSLQLPISLDAFEQWRSRTGAASDMASLKHFAAIVIGAMQPSAPTEGPSRG